MRKFVEEPLSFWSEDPNNTRNLLNPEEEQRLGESLLRAQLEPLLADMAGMVLDGGRRLRAAKRVDKATLFGILTDEPLSPSEVNLITSFHKVNLSAFDTYLRVVKWFKENPEGKAKDLALRISYDPSMVSKIYSLKDCIPAVFEGAKAGCFGISVWNEFSKQSAEAQHAMLPAALNGASREELKKGRGARNGLGETKVKRVSIPCVGGTVTVSGGDHDLISLVDLVEKLLKDLRKSIGKIDLKAFIAVQKRKAVTP